MMGLKVIRCLLFLLLSCFLLLLLNLSQEKTNKKQLIVKDVNGKIAL